MTDRTGYRFTGKITNNWLNLYKNGFNILQPALFAILDITFTYQCVTAAIHKSVKTRGHSSFWKSLKVPHNYVSNAQYKFQIDIVRLSPIRLQRIKYVFFVCLFFQWFAPFTAQYCGWVLDIVCWVYAGWLSAFYTSFVML